ncbi:DUF2381 family protein [Pyxidicoccus parkwayensis]|uniref:DUF2381 family protein n=1 Tax=Pyxidicoccus parkwayensis TaxID=2813578 RepID=A0ABX7NQW7_9BACT|nr:DUF2381 family protein [Pyxidicoccus parkwaysis]QSQ19849.1 DUF2381 family protein [Pyxidicoccus parkwaysis]
MRLALLRWSVTVLILGSSVAVAREPDEPAVRNIYLSDDPSDTASAVYVAGGVGTLLRFDQPCDPARTKLLDWDGRFEPLLVNDRTVMLMPLHDLTPGDRFLLSVGLKDGQDLPFVVTASNYRVDQQVNVFMRPESTEAMRAALADARARESALFEENQRRKKEETSVDHALAALVLKGAFEQTRFFRTRSWLLKGDEADISVRSYSGIKKAALVFEISNHHGAQPWKLLEARVSLASTGESRPFALRVGQDAIHPGTTGAIAIIADESAFRSAKGLDKLVVDIFRADGLQQAQAVLEWRPQRD